MCSTINMNDAEACSNDTCNMKRPELLFECDECGVQQANKDCLCCPICAKSAASKGKSHQGAGSSLGDDDIRAEDKRAEDTLMSVPSESSQSPGKDAVPCQAMLGQHDVCEPGYDANMSQAKHANDFVSPGKTRLKRNFTDKLPIQAIRSSLVEQLFNQRIVICKSEPGAGKTSQLPQFCADALNKFPKAVLCTLPSRLAADGAAQRIAHEHEHATATRERPSFAETRPNGHVKLITQSADRELARINFTSEECFIQMYSSWPDLVGVSVLVIDEAQERSVNTDIILGLAKQLLKKRLDIFILVTISCGHEDKLMSHFGVDRRHLIEVPNHQASPVAVEHAALVVPPATLLPSHQDIVDLVVKKLPATEKHTLVFLPCQQDIEACIRLFMTNPARSPLWVPVKLFATLPLDQQRQAMDFEHEHGCKGARMVAFCDSLADNMVTLPGVGLVVDTGLAYCSSFDSTRRLFVTELTYISQVSSDIRKNKAGRASSGTCVRTYDYQQCPITTPPEILRRGSRLEPLCLALCNLPQQNPKTFPFIEQPSAAAVDASMRMLAQWGCLDDAVSGHVTDKGRLFFASPFEPRWSQFVDSVLRLDADACGEAIMVAAVHGAVDKLLYAAKTTEEREQRQKLITGVSERCLGDMCFAAGVLQAWAGQGRFLLGTKACATCNKPAGSACSCHKPFASAHSNNNAVADQLLDVIVQARKAFMRPDAAPLQYSGAHLELIGKCLVQCFPEHVFFPPFRHQIQQGIVSPQGDIAAISATSVFMHDSQSAAIEAVYVDKLIKTKNRLVAEGLEPVNPAWGAGSFVARLHKIHSDFAQPVCVEHLGPTYQAVRFLPELRGRCIVGSRPECLNTMEFYARREDAELVRDRIKAAKKLIDAKDPIVCLDILEGAVKVRLKPGLEVEDANFASDACRVYVRVVPEDDGRLPEIDKVHSNLRVSSDLLAEPSRYVAGKLQLTFKSAQHAAPFMQKRKHDIDGQLSHGIYQPTIALSCNYCAPKTCEMLQSQIRDLEVKVVSKPTQCVMYRSPTRFIRDCASDMQGKGGTVEYQNNNVYVYFPAAFDLSFYLKHGWVKTSGGPGKLVIKGIPAERRTEVLSTVRGIKDLEVDSVTCKLSAPPQVTESLWKCALNNVFQQDASLKVEDMPQQPGGDRWARIECKISASSSLVAPKARNTAKSGGTKSCEGPVLDCCERLDKCVSCARGTLQVKPLPLPGYIGWITLRKLRERPPGNLRAEFPSLEVRFPDEVKKANCSRLETLSVSLTGLQADVMAFAKVCWDTYTELQKHSRFIPVSTALSKLLKMHKTKLEGDTGIVWDCNAVVVAGSCKEEFEKAFAKLAPIMAAVKSTDVTPCAACGAASQLLLHRCG